MSRPAPRLLVLVMATLLATGWLTATPQPAKAAGSISLISGGVAYSQDFNTLANSGTSSSVPTGWDFLESGANANTLYNTGTGSNNAGDTYSFGGALNTERAFGGLLSGSLTPTIGASFTNATGFAIVSFDIAYTGEFWRAGVLNRGAADRLDFQLSTNAAGLGSGTWTDFDSLDFNTPNINAPLGAQDGNASGNRVTLASSVTGLSVANGATFWIRWSDFNIASSDDGLGIDDFSLTPTVDDSISLSINDRSQNEGNSGTGAMNFTVSLSNPAGPGGVTFDIATADGVGPGGATTADNDYVATSDPDGNIPEGESSYTFTVGINGDTAVEPDQAFFVNVTDVTGVDAVTDGQGQGTIVNDDTDPCTQSFTPIYSIQGSGLNAAITGTVTTQGVVTGDFEGTAANQGFYLQDAAGDGDAATSDGIFVFTGSNNFVNAGEVVRVTGFARERFNQTTLNGSNSNTSPVTNILDCGTSGVAATDVNLPFANASFPERYEGMSVRFPQPLVIAEYFNYDRFGEMVLALPLADEIRPFTGTAIDEPGAPALARALANSLSRITLDDNQSAQNPPFLRHPNGAQFTLGNLFRGGDHVQNAVGVLGFDFSLYRIFPTGPADYSADNDRPPPPELPDGSLRVAAMNTLNFFLTADAIQDDSGPNNPADDVCGGGANLECRGWDLNQATELQRQRDKLLQALAGLDADVLGLNELENTPLVDPLGDPTNGIVAGLNAIFGPGTYAPIDTGTIGTDAIKVGLIYKPNIVTPVGLFQVLDSADDPRFIDTKSRPALAQTFEEIATGARFTVVVNHLKSKGSACTDVGDPDAGDGQGNCNGTRTLAAQALVDWIATDPTGAGDPDFLIMGDLNSYAKEDPIDAIKAGSDDTAGTGDDWTNLIEQYVGTFAYSFVFDGQSGYLDHALANPSIASQVVDADEWHINADEPDILDYDTSFKPAAQDALYEPNQFRTSDHDPVLLGLSLINDAPTIAVTAGNSCSSEANGGSFTLVVDDNEVAAGDLTVSLTDNTNTTLVPNGNVVFGGSGANRTVAITAANKLSGTAVLTIGVNDGFQTVTTMITVTVGTHADDAFVGSAGADLLIGGQGSDDLMGLGGADVLCGGQGNDSLAGGEGADALDGGQGSDGLSGGEGNDRLVGGQGNDALSGDGEDDTLTGNAGADAFSGGTGTDTNTDVTPSQGDTWDGT